MTSPGFVPAKASASTSTCTISSSPTTPPAVVLPLLHQAAQSGDLEQLRILLKPDSPLQPTANANDRDAQNITALHWSAINNHLLASKFLLEMEADVDARGGDLNATPLHWAARSATQNMQLFHRN